MPFFDEVKEIFEDALDLDSVKSSCFVIGNKSVHIEGIFGITLIDESEIVLSLKTKRIRITGTDLKVVRSQADNASVAGNIKSISFE